MNGFAFFRVIGGVNAMMARRRLRSLIYDQSRLMGLVIGLFVLGYWVGAYLLFRSGFMFLAKVPGLQVILLDRMLYLFFAFLFGMLMFSNMIIGYSTLFKSTETQWMMTLPVRHTDIFRWKLVETTLLASWAFIFLSAPLLLAYGQARQVTLWFYLKVALLFVPFTIIPAALGALVILVVTRYLHRHMFKWALFALGAAGLVVALFMMKPTDVESIQSQQLIANLNQLLHHTRMTENPMMPSFWLASGMIAWGENWTGRGIFYFAVLLSNAMMAMLVCVTASGRWFYVGWSRNHSQGQMRLGVSLLDRRITMPRTSLVTRFIGGLPGLEPATRALIIKDVRVFWRDTAQWSQFVIFFGLLGMYVLNLRNVAFDASSDYWASFICFLNLGASCMTLATLTTRFVFPQFSLEGKRLWMVGMVPYGLRQVLLEKFWLSSLFSAAITLSLMLVSSAMLRVPAWLTLLYGATVVVMSFALCGIAVGIGVLFPNFGSGSTANRRDDNPAKIVSGFGGTFCFVLSLAYIVVIIAAEVVPMYVNVFPVDLGEQRQPIALMLSWLLVSVISLIATCVPMSLALKRVETIEL